MHRAGAEQRIRSRFIQAALLHDDALGAFNLLALPKGCPGLIQFFAQTAGISKIRFRQIDSRPHPVAADTDDDEGIHAGRDGRIDGVG